MFIIFSFKERVARDDFLAETDLSWTQREDLKFLSCCPLINRDICSILILHLAYSPHTQRAVFFRIFQKNLRCKLFFLDQYTKPSLFFFQNSALSSHQALFRVKSLQAYMEITVILEWFYLNEVVSTYAKTILACTENTLKEY